MGNHTSITDVNSHSPVFFAFIPDDDVTFSCSMEAKVGYPIVGSMASVPDSAVCILLPVLRAGEQHAGGGHGFAKPGAVCNHPLEGC